MTKHHINDPHHTEHSQFNRTERNKLIKKRKKRTRRIIIWSTIFILFAGLTYFLATFWSSVQNAASEITRTVKTENIRESSVQKTDPFTVLLVGLDKGGEYGYSDEPARADTLIVATVNPSTNEITLVSIPRDTLVPMQVPRTSDGYGLIDKINHSYAYGDIEGTINTVQNYLQVPIDEYVQIDINGLIKLVDSLGGVTVKSPITFQQEGYSFVEGEEIHLNGFSANLFARMRLLDPEGTAGREKRQRILIGALAKKLLSIDALINYQQILDTLSSNIRMSFTLDRLFQLKDVYSSVFNNMKQDHLTSAPIDINNGYYDLILDKEHLRISNLLRQKLNLPEITQDTLLSKGISTTSYKMQSYRLYNSNDYLDNEGNYLNTGLPYNSDESSTNESTSSESSTTQSE
ncbi:MULTISPECIES: LCP family protein [unclassified Granulicatella]|uniref:LCP family glycopolymer transferase n=1 Tax=unclassified Granulicatella TaxID=2630493 RepID=UPI001431037C|nr:MULTISPECIES: LCP family protein [unclassified Granulicatella]MBF0780960.1 LCP family protein [Granulicatella sp. 19428wC4_WM01]